MPTRLLEQYEAAEGDPELISLRSDLALTEVHTQELLARLGGEDSAARWQAVKDAYDDYQRDRAPEHLKAVGDAITAATPDDGVWEQIHKVADIRRKLNETEQRRIERLQQSLSMEQATTLVMRILGIANELIHDPHDKTSVLVALRALLVSEQERTRSGDSGAESGAFLPETAGAHA